MDWKTPLIIVRPQADGKVLVVNESASLKDARYWLNYIAEPFDALFLTPLNAKYVGSGDPIYSCHLISRAKTEYNENAWKEKVFDNPDATTLNFSTENNPVAKKQSKSDELQETEIIMLADGKPKSLSLDQIKKIINSRNAKLKVILAEPTKWIDWESALTLMTKEVHVIGIGPDPKWPLSVTLDPKNGKGEDMNYSEQMKFVVRVSS